MAIGSIGARRDGCEVRSLYLLHPAPLAPRTSCTLSTRRTFRTYYGSLSLVIAVPSTTNVINFGEEGVA